MTDPTTPSTTDVPAPEPTNRPRRWVRCALKAIGLLLLAFVLLCLTGWAALAIYYADLSGGATPRTLTTILYLLAVLAAITFIKPRKYGVATVFLLFLVVLTWYLCLSPSNDRDWSPDVAQLPYADIEGDRLTVHNVRNFHYRSETDFTPEWVTRTYDLSKISSADFILVYWGSKAVAHAMVSFEFEDGQCLAISIETRKEKTESYSAVQGFFRQYELYYVFADERDVVRLRTNFRNEDVYLYRTTFTPHQARMTLLSNVANANRLKQTPEFYNALTSNCATNVITNARDGGVNAYISWESRAGGYAARQAYRNGRLDTSLPYEELEKRSHVNAAAIAAGTSEDFSKLIRAGLPKPAPREPAP